jgi:hypothetical protein
VTSDKGRACKPQVGKPAEGRGKGIREEGGGKRHEAGGTRHELANHRLVNLPKVGEEGIVNRDE